jgi:hypothetical protein
MKEPPARRTYYDSDDSAESGRGSSVSVDSYDVDQLLVHHQNENIHINNNISENLPLSPSREGGNESDGDVKTGGGVRDAVLLSDSSGMGEEFCRLQKMYKRVQGKNHS